MAAKMIAEQPARVNRGIPQGASGNSTRELPDAAVEFPLVNFPDCTRRLYAEKLGQMSVKAMM
jgi:hypothetical protein